VVSKNLRRDSETDWRLSAIIRFELSQVGSWIEPVHELDSAPAISESPEKFSAQLEFKL